jgi:nitrate reductase NapD
MSAHIASVIVRTRPEHALEIARRLDAPPATEVHAVEDGKIIVVLEADSEHALSDRMDELRREPGVLFVNLVYHQLEQA